MYSKVKKLCFTGLQPCPHRNELITGRIMIFMCHPAHWRMNKIVIFVDMKPVFDKSRVIRLLIISLAGMAMFVDHLYFKIALILGALILFLIKNYRNKKALTYFVFVIGLGVIGALVIPNIVMIQ